MDNIKPFSEDISTGSTEVYNQSYDPVNVSDFIKTSLQGTAGPKNEEQAKKAVRGLGETGRRNLEKRTKNYLWFNWFSRIDKPQKNTPEVVVKEEKRFLKYWKNMPKERRQFFMRSLLEAPQWDKKKQKFKLYRIPPYSNIPPTKYGEYYHKDKGWY